MVLTKKNGQTLLIVEVNKTSEGQFKGNAMLKKGNKLPVLWQHKVVATRQEMVQMLYGFTRDLDNLEQNDRLDEPTNIHTLLAAPQYNALGYTADDEQLAEKWFGENQETS